MSQGLRNAPMIYMRMMNNALFGFISMPPGVPEEDESGEPYDMFTQPHLDLALPSPEIT